MPSFGLKAHLELVNQYKLGNRQKHLKSHVIRF
jgi:hypothetical protein